VPVVVVPSGTGEVITPLLKGQPINPAAPSQGIIYTSVGERWDSVAYKMYGDSTQVGLLIQYNPGILVADYIPAGTNVFVPLLTPPAVTTSTTPWG